VALHLAEADAQIERAEMALWRAVSGEEVDFAVKTCGRLLPIENKVGASAARRRAAAARVPHELRQVGADGAAVAHREHREMARAEHASQAMNSSTRNPEAPN